MSTAYPPRLIKYAFSSKKERQAAKATPMSPAFYGEFPAAFGLYYVCPGKDFLSQNFHISELSSEDPAAPMDSLYAVHFHKGPGLQQMTIYSTHEHASTPMSVASNAKRYGNSLAVSMPPAKQGDPPRTEQVRYKGFAANAIHAFSINGEDYEWREDRSTTPRKRRLIRTSGSSTGSSAGSDGKSTEQDDAEPSHPTGPELIATWTEGAIPNRYGRLAVFSLSDKYNGKSTSEAIGSYAALVAVSAVLGACQSGSSIEGSSSWNQEKMLEKGHYGDKDKPQKVDPKKEARQKKKAQFTGNYSYGRVDYDPQAS